MRGVSFVVLLATVACGRIEFEPLSPPPRVQTGEISLDDGLSNIVTAIDPVDPDHSFLTFARNVTDLRPESILVTGRLMSDHILFERASTKATTLVRWSVITWEGMSVRRGSTTFTNQGIHTVAFATPIATNRSFVLFTHRESGQYLDDDEFLDVQIAPDQLVFRVGVANTSPITIEWQLIEIPGANVHHGGTVIVPGAATQEIATPAIDPSRAWLVFSQSFAGDPPTEARDYGVRGEILGSARVRFDRGSTNGTATISWSLVELARGQVQHVTETFGASEDVRSAEILPVAPSRTFVHSSGATDTAGATLSLAPGPADVWTIAQLVDDASVQIRRAAASERTTATWNVVGFE